MRKGGEERGGRVRGVPWRVEWSFLLPLGERKGRCLLRVYDRGCDNDMVNVPCSDSTQRHMLHNHPCYTLLQTTR